MSTPITIAEAGPQIRDGRLTPLDLVERCLNQIDKHESRIQAWVSVDVESARQTARELGEEISRGNCRGPLHGIPVGIKDIVDVAGWPTKAGSPLRENHVAGADAPLVATLRQAGAIILGKTVTVEFACFDPPPTRNPWDLELKHTPGGSSSGSAAALALGMCLGAIGTQTGGSLVRPGSYCGIATCKPTFGRVSRDAVVPVSLHLDHAGPMARCVADLAILLKHLPRANDFQPAAAVRPERPTSELLPPRLGLVEEVFLEEADASIRQTTEDALARLRDAGAVIEPIGLPDGFRKILPMHGRIMAADAAAYHREQFLAHRDAYGPMITDLLDEGLAMSAVDYASALAHQMQWRARIGSIFENTDALIMPATDTTAPATLATTGDKRFQAPWSYLGVPVVSIPCALAPDGMPAAVQLVGAYHRDVDLLHVAQWCESKIDFNELPPAF